MFLNARLIFQKDDGPQILLALEDISDLKEAERALEANEAKYRELVQNANSIILRMDPKGKVTFFNEFAQTFFSYTEEEILGCSVVGTIVPEIESSGRDLDFMIKDIGIHPENYINNENENMRRNGERVWVAWTNKAIRDENGKVKEILCIGNDITERRQLRSLLEESEERYRRLFETANDGILLLEKREGKITHANPSAMKMLGYCKEECIGKKLQDIGVSLDTGDLQKIMQTLEKSGIIYYDDVPVKTKTGQYIDTDIYMVDRARLIQCNIRDITERKRTVDELKRANEDLRQFAFIASHDLQSPLKNVEGFAHMLARRYKGKLDPKADEIIGHISNGVKDMQELILDVLEYSRVEDGQRVFTDVNTRRCIEKAIVNLKEIITERHASIHYEENLPVVRGDSSLLISLFQNLISNAIKFSGGMPEVSISAKNEDRNYVFAVSDKGIGIEPEYCQRIFDVFQRLHGQGKYHGTGIGLAICKKIVERHGGRIWVESEPRKGSTFYFTLPSNNNSTLPT